MLIKLSTDKTVSDTSIGLQAAAQANRFDVIEIHDLKASMEKAGVKSARECLTSILPDGAGNEYIWTKQEPLGGAGLSNLGL
jgi:hypothetical protein